jgi:hypothetical protein
MVAGVSRSFALGLLQRGRLPLALLGWGTPLNFKEEDNCVIQTSGGERSARSYAAWISLFCGLAALLFIAAFFVHLRLVRPNGTGSRWIGLWFASGWLSSLLGTITGILGKNWPRALGLSLSACAFMWFFALAFST